MSNGYQNINNQLLSQLIENNFIIDNKVDEYKKIVERYLDFKKNQRRLELYVILTMECNFDCPYCFQTREKHSIDNLLANSIIKLVKYYCLSALLFP